MFDLVNKYRTPVMWLCVVLMGGFGAFYLVADTLSGRGPVVEEVGRFKLPGGETVSVTNFEIDATFKLARQSGRLFPDEGSKTPRLANDLRIQTEEPDEAVWAFIILSRAAKAAGFAATDASVVAEANESRLRQQRPGDPAPELLTVESFRKNFNEEMRGFWRDLSVARRFRNSLDPIEEPTYERLFERYKTDFEEFRAEFVLFDGAAFEATFDPRSSAEDRAELEKWFSEEAQRGVRLMKQIPEQGDFEVLYARFQDADPATLAATYAAVWAPKAVEAGVTVTDEEVQNRFNRFRDAYQPAIDAARKKSDAESRPAAPDFDAVKELVRIELTVVKLAAAVHAQLKRPELALTFEQVKDPYALNVGTLNKADSVEIVKQPDFGSAQAQEAVFGGFGDGTLKKGDILTFQGVADGYAVDGPVDDPGRSVSIWRVMDRRDAREPVLDDSGILDYAIEKYLEKKKQDEAKRLADEFKKAVDDKLAELVKAREAELDAEMAKAVEEEAAKQGLSKDKVEDRPKYVQIENQKRVERNTKLDEAKAEHEARVFREVAAEKGAIVRDSGTLVRNVTAPARFAADEVKLPIEEKAARFFRKPQRMAALSALKVGRVGQVENEPTWAVAGVCLLTERREPSPEGLWRLGEQQMARLRQSVNPAQPPVWNYEALKSAKWFSLDAPDIESRRSEEAKRKANEDTTNRRLDERRREQLRRKADTLIEAVRDRTSPIKSGDNW